MIIAYYACALLAWFQNKKSISEAISKYKLQVFCYNTFYISAFIVFRILKVHCNDTLKKNLPQLFIISL